MYWILGKLFGIITLFVLIGMLFTKKGRLFIDEVSGDMLIYNVNYKGDILSDILSGDIGDMSEMSTLDMMLTGGLIIFIMIIYIFISILLSLLTVMMYPLILCYVLLGYFLRRKANKNKV